MIRSCLTSVCLLWFWAFASAADPFPALYDVTGVAADDALNVRADPDASSEIIGSFAPFRPGIEVVRPDPTGRWGLVNVGERSGWVSMRYLAQQPGQDGQSLPQPLYCSGTEPYWSARISTNPDLRFEVLGEAALLLDDTTYANAAGRSDKYAALWSGFEIGVVGMITRTICNDGMSDRDFGFAADFVTFGHVGSGVIYSGCCSLSGN